ncbi:MAG TPA: carboxypeptidase-like regulatory domain-containing protein [Bryobacteraceae bacterium]|nr:carboxypeptidase-like regulatory domain-containing protein [Bryobacteraceae bacterium]
MMNFTKSGVLTLVFLCFPASVFAQASDANLTGLVTDATGAGVAAAAVSIENPATGFKQTAETLQDGTYRFNNLPPASYTVNISKTGFAASSRRNVQLESTRTSTLNVTLEVGAVATTVEVTEAAAIIDTTTATLQNTYTAAQATRMPITGFGSGATNLGVINLSLLSAGVTSSGGVGYGTGPSIGGQRPTNNNFMIDGLDNNNRSVTGPSTTVSNEAVAEFSLGQNQVSAEFGQSTGGQFNTILKTGTNQLHGSLYEYFQNKHLNAVDESFARQGIRTAPRYDQNRFGGTVGGPVVKNRWFYFGNYERTVLGQASTSAGAVSAPTAEGINTLRNLQGVNKQNLENFTRYVPQAPAASSNITVLGQQIPVGVINVTGPAYSNFDSYIVSSDYNFSERDQLRARYIYNRTGSINTSNVSLPEFFTPQKQSYHFASLSH